MKLTGIHHVSIFTANARANFDFYTKIMGLRLVKNRLTKMTLIRTTYITETKSVRRGQR